MEADTIVSGWHKAVQCGESTLVELAVDEAQKAHPDKPLHAIMKELLEAWAQLTPQIPIKTNPVFTDARMHCLKPGLPVGDLFFSVVCQIAATDPAYHTGIIKVFISKIKECESAPSTATKEA